MRAKEDDELHKGYSVCPQSEDLQPLNEKLENWLHSPPMNVTGKCIKSEQGLFCIFYRAPPFLPGFKIKYIQILWNRFY